MTDNLASVLALMALMAGLIYTCSGPDIEAPETEEWTDEQQRLAEWLDERRRDDREL